MGEWSFLSALLDKVQSHSTVFGKVWMSVLFLFRIFILAAGVDHIWGDEQANLKCNTITPGCLNTCYDHSFPLSHTRFWVLQILTVSTPTLVYLGHVLLVIRQENKMRKRPQKKTDTNKFNNVPKYSDERGRVELKGVLLASYMLQLVFKTLFEVSFIVVQYYLYGFILMPNTLTCSKKQMPCKGLVNCYISRPTEKSVFIVFMLVVTVFSVLLNIIEMLHLMVLQIKNRKRST